MSSLTRIASFRISPQTTLDIVRGSVVHFEHDNKKAAIVNAANQGCLGGGGVDGAISAAGGLNLHKDRLKLPVVSGDHVRCPTGDAKATGPNKYGSLNVPYVIHAVGPCYYDYDTMEEGDELLESAYKKSLDCAREAELEAVAFSLLSAGVFRGKRTVRQVLSIGISSICDWVQKQADSSTLSKVVLCGFNPHEVNTLVDICEDDLQLKVAQQEDNEQASDNDDKEADGGHDAVEEEKKGGDVSMEETKGETAGANKEEAKGENAVCVAEEEEKEGVDTVTEEKSEMQKKSKSFSNASG